MNSSKKSCLAVIMAVLLVLAFSLPVMAGDSINSDPVTQSSETGNDASDTAIDAVAGDPGEQNSADGNQVQDNPVDTESPTSETPANEFGDQPVVNSGPDASAPAEIPSELVHTAMQIRSGNISPGQDIFIDATLVLADGLASAAVNRMAVELTKFYGPIGSDEVLVYAGPEQIELTDQGGVAKGYWTPSEPILLEGGNRSATCTFVFKFLQGGQYNLNIFADGIHYRVEEKAPAPEVKLQMPAPQETEDPLAGIDDNKEALDEAGKQTEENSGGEADGTNLENGTEQTDDSENNGSGVAADNSAGITEEEEQSAGSGQAAEEQTSGGTVGGENSSQNTEGNAGSNSLNSGSGAGGESAAEEAAAGEAI